VDTLDNKLFAVIHRLLDILLVNASGGLIEVEPEADSENAPPVESAPLDAVAGYALPDNWTLEDEDTRDPVPPDIGDPVETD
jgi:hypothetical protein